MAIVSPALSVRRKDAFIQKGRDSYRPEDVRSIGDGSDMRFDLELFSELNEEYKSRPVVRRAPVYKKANITHSGNRRAATLNSKYSLAGKRVIEIGCGRGETCRAIAKT